MVAIKFKYEGVIKRVTVDKEQLRWQVLVDTLRQIYSIQSVEFLTWTFQLDPPSVIRSEADFTPLIDKLKSTKVVICLLEQTLSLQDILEKLLLIPSNLEIVKDLLTRYKACNPHSNLDTFFTSPDLRPSLSLTMSRIFTAPSLPTASQFRLVMCTEDGRQFLKAVPSESYTDYSTLHVEDLRASLSAKALKQVLAPGDLTIDKEEGEILDELQSEESEGSDVDTLAEDARLLLDHDSDQDLDETH